MQLRNKTDDNLIKNILSLVHGFETFITGMIIFSYKTLLNYIDQISISIKTKIIEFNNLTLSCFLTLARNKLLLYFKTTTHLKN